ncbi:ABC transporter permease [Bacillus halotolerans]|uniref:ABC transporter permease n=1 Tax=Bacillus halotolerans TaxID=260554 RepID=A0ABY7I5B4_9BACI|nr:ABC transporter permease [Bacillus halotolerans]MBV5121222.1 ABC transporter permease [Bacillus halotolerans]MDG0766281.1 ABC transporter permease [Bacillus halotolerans]UUI85258.1 ABC transporter permease [Bacillus halotolerans]WAT22310.1 ABC transporter permease [Bacillus halotolerans]
MLNLIYNEWIKIFSRVGTWVMIGILALTMIGWAFLTNHFSTDEANPKWKETLQAQNADLKKAMKEDPSLKGQYEETITINNYRIEHNIPSDTGYTVWSYVTDSAGFTILTGLFTIIIAAGIVANEFNWGTVKLLMIRPLSRFQILLSKYITVLLFGFLLLFILFMGSTLLGLVFFGTGGDTAANVHLIYKDGHVLEQNMLGYLAKTYLSESVAALMLATMAFMLSAVFRNSSLAVGFSIFLLVTGTTATAFIAMKFDWAKYILFANVNLMQYVEGSPLVEGMTMTFSIVMLAIYFVVFLLLAFGIFMKRDIAN